MATVHEAAMRVGTELAGAGIGIDARMFPPVPSGFISTIDYLVPATVGDIDRVMRHIESQSVARDETDRDESKIRGR